MNNKLPTSIAQFVAIKANDVPRHIKSVNVICVDVD